MSQKQITAYGMPPSPIDFGWFDTSTSKQYSGAGDSMWFTSKGNVVYENGNDVSILNRELDLPFIVSWLTSIGMSSVSDGMFGEIGEL